MANYKNMTIPQLEQLNNDLGAQQEKILEERLQLREALNHKLKVEQVNARYGGKVKADDFDFMREHGLLPPDSGIVIRPAPLSSKSSKESPSIAGKKRK